LRNERQGERNFGYLFEAGCILHRAAIRNAAANLLSEIVGTFFLVFIAGAIFSKAVAKGGIAAGLGPYLVGCLVWAIGLSLGGTSGYAINPARDLGPRLAHAVLPIAGKGNSDWSYASILVVGPLVGASLAFLLLHALNV
jgi:glycerol uptake facilitator protein